MIFLEFFAILLVRNKEANDMIIRPQYMNTLKTYRDVPLVKILAESGAVVKSTILDMLRADLLKSGLPQTTLSVCAIRRRILTTE